MCGTKAKRQEFCVKWTWERPVIMFVLDDGQEKMGFGTWEEMEKLDQSAFLQLLSWVL